jgi:Outer membrane protein beta-barrel domain
MKKFLLLLPAIIFVLTFSNAHAQGVSIGIRGGVSIPNLSASGSENNPLNTGYKSRVGPDIALFAEFHLSSLFSIEPMLEYSSQGGKKDGYQAFPTPAAISQFFAPGTAPTYLYATFNSEAKLDYLMLPVLAKFGWDFGKQRCFRFYVDAGPFGAILLSAKQVTSGSSMIYADKEMMQPLPIGTHDFDSTTNIKSDTHDGNFGISANIGLAYHIHRCSFFIEGGGNYGFINIQKGTANGKNNTGAGTICIGYSYFLNK